MMKKMRYIAALTLVVLITSGCADDSDVARSKPGNGAKTIDDLIAEQNAASDMSSLIAEYGEYEEEDEDASYDDILGASDSSAAASSFHTAEEIDVEGDYVDLTKQSSTMIYTTVYNMMYYPENFVGKTIKMTGNYSEYIAEDTGKRYFACIIKDATACCSQGVEFELTEDYKYPDNYPKEADPITVEGVFDLYKEGEYQYCTLRNAKLCES
ncbi:hypothetical protein SAMN02910451_02358 [Butyrivibrio hungatei]|uniref:Lipoprotein n=1 Tax=Butyrivibrio hungatei TaxID=185008 RepID=A0A1G5FDG1_9FIRM|nr:hypothetical protein [Butyrivibrio hungatei]SCY36920.1 hypothetical protein SAMN02910451_02358 [Butyrivibrio hungatei]